MTRDELIKLAKQAGFQADSFGIGIWDSQDFNDFARLVAEHEREECARVCDNADQEYDCIGVPYKLNHTCADAIRARTLK